MLIQIQDMLPAFSGIASLFQRVSGEEYLAGLLANIIAKRPPVDHHNYRTQPSWSWLVLPPRQPVRVQRDDLGPSGRFKVLSVIRTLKGSDPLGCIEQASLGLRGLRGRVKR